MSKSVKEITNSINTIVKTGAKLRSLCHTTLVDVIDHYIEHGDTTLIPALETAIKNSLGSSIAQAMNTWISKFCPSLVWDDKAKKFNHMKGVDKRVVDITAEMNVKFKADKKEDGKVFVGNARQFPFYEMEREVDVKPFLLEGAILALIKRAESALEANTKDHAHNMVNAAQIDILKSVAKSIKEVAPVISDDELSANLPKAEIVPAATVKAARGRKAKVDSDQKAVAA